jgi:hypothetical protein
LIKDTVVDAFPAAVQKGADGKEQRDNVVAYLQTGDSGRFKAKQLLSSLIQIRHGSHCCYQTRPSDYSYLKRLGQTIPMSRICLIVRGYTGSLARRQDG